MYEHYLKFQKSEGTEMDLTTGKQVPVLTDLASKHCTVYDLSAEKKTELFGRTTKHASMIYHRGKMVEGATQVQMDGKTFVIKDHRQIRFKSTYLILEV